MGIGCCRLATFKVVLDNDLLALDWNWTQPKSEDSAWNRWTTTHQKGMADTLRQGNTKSIRHIQIAMITITVGHTLIAMRNRTLLSRYIEHLVTRSMPTNRWETSRNIMSGSTLSGEAQTTQNNHNKNKLDLCCACCGDDKSKLNLVHTSTNIPDNWFESIGYRGRQRILSKCIRQESPNVSGPSAVYLDANDFTFLLAMHHLQYKARSSCVCVSNSRSQ